ncbi:MAG: hypothetical protein AB7O57_00270 [Hyphomicrobiaceae bacterium]
MSEAGAELEAARQALLRAQAAIERRLDLEPAWLALCQLGEREARDGGILTREQAELKRRLMDQLDATEPDWRLSQRIEEALAALGSAGAKLDAPTRRTMPTLPAPEQTPKATPPDTTEQQSPVQLESGAHVLKRIRTVDRPAATEAFVVHRHPARGAAAPASPASSRAHAARLAAPPASQSGTAKPPPLQAQLDQGNRSRHGKPASGHEARLDALENEIDDLIVFGGTTPATRRVDDKLGLDEAEVEIDASVASSRLQPARPVAPSSLAERLRGMAGETASTSDAVAADEAPDTDALPISLQSAVDEATVEIILLDASKAPGRPPGKA